MDKIIIGKHALESLTTGMYADPFVVFREYIQNSADSIDEAIEKGIIEKGEEKIEVILLPTERKIIIQDNGVGINYDKAEKVLISIGNSKKIFGQSRGFRGIGRLAALSYCGKLIFETSFYQEEKGTRLTIDAKKLLERLLLEEQEDVSVEEVLESVYMVEAFPEAQNNHYFRAILEEVDCDSNLNKFDDVLEYLSQNTPVAYNDKKFVWGKEIKKRILNEGYFIPEYNIYLSYGGTTIQVFKPYEDIFSIDKKGNITDNIKDIHLIKMYSIKGDMSVVGWIAQTGFLGSIYDKKIKGIRMRKGNILIGDSQTMNVIFKDARFNGCILGELYIIDQQLIPNARRDNFEKNNTYFMLIEQLRNMAADVVKNIRMISASRNNVLSKIIDETEKLKEETTRAIEDDNLTTFKKAAMRKRLENTKAVLAQISENNSIDLYNKEIAFDELDILIGKLQGNTAYKALNAMQSLSKTEKKVLEKVLDIIVVMEFEGGDELIDTILQAFV